MSVNWKGVIPAITTPFDADLGVDHAFLAEHGQWMVDHGCVGLVALGSLGEAATLSLSEKGAVLETLVRAVGDRVPVLPGISALGTAEAVALARAAAKIFEEVLRIDPQNPRAREALERFRSGRRPAPR